VELTKAMGSEYYGGGLKETSDTNLDFDNMIKTTSESKTRGDESIMRGSMGLLTEKDKEEYLAANPEAREHLKMLEEFELTALGADISASAKTNGDGVNIGRVLNETSRVTSGLVPGSGIPRVQGFNGGGLVQGFQGGGSVKFSGAQLKGLLDSQKGIGTTVKKPTVKPTVRPSSSGSRGTFIKLAKEMRSVGTVENENVVINRIPAPETTQQGGGGQSVPVPVGGGSSGQPISLPSIPSYFQIVNSIRISSLLTKLSIT